jgi:hypothetical protein
MAEPRWCYYVPSEQRNSHGFIPSVVREGEGGHSPMIGNGAFAVPWYWGQTHEEAERVCAQANAELGLSEEDVIDIVSSSMAAPVSIDVSSEASMRLAEVLAE